MRLEKTWTDSFFKVREWYVFLYLTYLALSMFIPFRVATEAISSYIYTVVAFVGVLILLLDLWLSRKNLKKIEYLFPLLFVLAGIISALVNYQYELFSNIKILAIMAVQFDCFYMLNTHWKNQGSKELVSKLMQSFLIIWFIAVGISLVEFVIGYAMDLGPDRGDLSYLRQGFYDERLFGTFADPNYASVLSVVAICFCVIFLLKRKEKSIFLKIYYIINIVMQWLYVVLSGSRTALLSLCVGLGAVVLILLWNYLTQKGLVQIHCFVIPILLALFCVGVICGCYTATKDAMSYVPGCYTEVEKAEDNQGSASTPQKTNLNREDVESSDNISNNRFTIWKDAITIWKSTPIVGATSRGYLEYAKDKIGNLYIVEKSYVIHNGYLSTLLFSGILGAIVMVAWIGFLLYRIIKYLLCQTYLEDSNYVQVVILFASVLAMSVATMLLSLVFYETMIPGALFWMMCGYLLELTKNPSKKKRNRCREYM